MIRLVLWFFVFLYFDILRGDATCTSFQVASVNATNTKHSELQSLTEEDLQQWASKNETLMLENAQLVHPLVDGFDNRVKNAFIATVFYAYSNHYPLELSVEDIWVIIAHGISMHVNKNSNSLWNMLVSHKAKKVLALDITDLQMPRNNQRPGINWPEAVRRMCEEIKADMKIDLTSIITKPFSETTPVQQAVFDSSLMDSVKSYYAYRVMVLCGIPQITLCGSAEDYQSIIDRLNQLKIVFTDLHWWLDPLISHMRKFKDSVEGKPDTDWWQQMVGTHRQGCGASASSKLTGWLVDFIP